MDDRDFLDDVAATLAALPAVEAVTLGGSRAQGTARPESDWDLGIYYRGTFDPQGLRDIGWEGDVFEVGGWGGGVFNGGAWLRVDGRRVDVHYRDLGVVEAEVDRAARGDFDIEPLKFHLAGIPTYLLVAELALSRALHGNPPTVSEYPQALRDFAPGVWVERADMTLSYAEHNHAPYGRVTQCLGLVAVAACEYAHAVLAADGVWATNDKLLLRKAGLEAVDDLVAAVTSAPGSLAETVAQVRALVHRRLDGPT